MIRSVILVYSYSFEKILLSDFSADTLLPLIIPHHPKPDPHDNKDKDNRADDHWHLDGLGEIEH